MVAVTVDWLRRVRAELNGLEEEVSPGRAVH